MLENFYTRQVLNFVQLLPRAISYQSPRTKIWWNVHPWFTHVMNVSHAEIMLVSLYSHDQFYTFFSRYFLRYLILTEDNHFFIRCSSYFLPRF